MRVPDVFGAVVIREPHDDFRPFWQANWLLVLVVSLPLEIPVLDPQQPPFCSVRQDGEALHVLCEVMGVRPHPNHRDIHREGVRLFTHVIAHARRDIELQRSQPDPK